MSEKKVYKRSIGLILPGFGNKEAVTIDSYNGKNRARFTIRDLIRDKIVSITLWEDVVVAKKEFLKPGSLVVADGVYSCRDKRNSRPGDDNKMHSISVSRSDSFWVQPSADSFLGLLEDDTDEVPDFDDAIGGPDDF